MLSIAKDFSVSFSNLDKNLMNKLPNLSNKYGVLSVAQYCSHLGLTKKFELLPTEKDYVSKILRDIDIGKTASIDKLSGTFLKVGAYVLAKLITSICNLSISLSKFLLLSKVFEKVVHKQAAKFLSDSNICYVNMNLASEVTNRGLFLSFLNDKILKGFDNRPYTGMILIGI